MDPVLNKWPELEPSTEPIGAPRPVRRVARPVTMEHPRVPVPLAVDEGQEVSPTQQIPRVAPARPAGSTASGRLPLRLDPDPEVPVAEQVKGRRSHAAEQDFQSRSRVSWSLVVLVAIVAVAAVCVAVAVQGAPRDAAALGFLSLCLAAVLSLVALVRRRSQ